MASQQPSTTKATAATAANAEFGRAPPNQTTMPSSVRETFLHDAAKLNSLISDISLQSFAQRIFMSKTLAHKLAWVLVFLVIGVIFIFCPIFMIIMGLANLKNCQAQMMIPIWLVVFGFVVLATVLINFMLIGLFCKDDKRQLVQRIIYAVVLLFLLIWTIVGSVWVFSLSNILIDKTYKDCNQDCFRTAFWLLIGVWVLVGFFISFFCLYLVYRIIFTKLVRKK